MSCEANEDDGTYGLKEVKTIYNVLLREHCDGFQLQICRRGTSDDL